MEHKGILGVTLSVGALVFAIGCESADTESTASKQSSVNQPALGQDSISQQAFGQQAITQQAVFQQANVAVPEDVKLVDDWFNVYRTVLSDLSKTKGRWEVRTDESGKDERVWVEPEFGFSRLMRTPGHGMPFSISYLGDQEKLAALQKGKDLHMRAWAYSAGTELLTLENIRMRMLDRSSPFGQPELNKADLKEIDKFAKRSFKSLQKKKDSVPRTQVREWDLQARMMRLNDKACLSCHIDNKLNDPVAVFVFATTPKNDRAE